MIRVLLLLSLISVVPARAAEWLVVANRGGSTITVIDVPTMTSLGAVSVGVDPHEAAISPDGRTAYVSNYGGGAGTTISIVDLPTRREIKKVELGASGPHGIMQVNGRVYVACDHSDKVVRYNPQKDAVDWSASTNGVSPHMLAVRKDESEVFTANILSASASIIPVTGATSASRKEITTVFRSEGIGLSPDERELWIGSVAGAGLSIIDLTTETVVATLANGTTNYRIYFTPDGRWALVPRGKGFVVFDPLTRSVHREVPVAGLAFSIVIDPESNFAYVAQGNPNQVSKVDLHTFQVVASVAVPPIADGIAFARYIEPPNVKRRAARVKE